MTLRHTMDADFGGRREGDEPVWSVHYETECRDTRWLLGKRGRGEAHVKVRKERS